MDEAKQWAIGDWLVDGKTHYGDGLYKRAAEILGVKDENELARYKRLCSMFALENRVHTLSFRHHYEAASIKAIEEDDEGKLLLSEEPDKDKIAELLKQAEDGEWSVVQLREAVRKHKEWQREHIAAANEPEKYAVIYADPPWQYTSGDQHTTEEQETVIGDHYPSMPLGDICSLPQASRWRVGGGAGCPLPPRPSRRAHASHALSNGHPGGPRGSVASGSVWGQTATQCRPRPCDAS